jgi:phospholipase C
MNDKLKQIEHIVVLTLENRSFDHMLGYLRLEGGRADIDGLDGTQSNEFAGVRYAPLLSTETAFKPDPHHEWENVAIQLSNNNGGFIQDFSTQKDGTPTLAPWRIMNYHNAAQLPTFDNLASQFCVCDRWFSSVPGATQPNRIYSLAGHSNGEKHNLSIPRLLLGWNVRPIFEFLPAGVTWKYYSHDIASLRYVRGYQALVPQIDKIFNFFDDVDKGTLPNVVWIDPDFGILAYPGEANDDHPSHDIRDGQNLVSLIYNALLNGPQEQWERTLLIVVYDEHGGFYDHVSPDAWQPDDDFEDFRRYGARVPAIVVSPWVGRQVAFGSQQNVVFDHTSILKTILLRFCTPENGAMPSMSARVNGANDLSVLLTEDAPRTDCHPAPQLMSFEESFVSFEAAMKNVHEEPPRPQEYSELQLSLAALAGKALGQDVPPEKL